MKDFKYNINQPLKPLLFGLILLSALTLSTGCSKTNRNVSSELQVRNYTPLKLENLILDFSPNDIKTYNDVEPYSVITVDSIEDLGNTLKIKSSAALNKVKRHSMYSNTTQSQIFYNLQASNILNDHLYITLVMDDNGNLDYVSNILE